jgi:hypothetical protein
MELYLNRYRTASTRLKSWDYGSDGYYFVTICVKNRQPKNKSNEKKWRPGVLGAVVGQFKIVTAKRIRQSGLVNFHWQTRFHDRILYLREDLLRTRIYIRINPRNA